MPDVNEMPAEIPYLSDFPVAVELFVPEANYLGDPYRHTPFDMPVSPGGERMYIAQSCPAPAGMMHFKIYVVPSGAAFWE